MKQCFACVFLLWGYILVLVVCVALLSRETRIFFPRTWRQSHYLSFYYSKNLLAVKKRGIDFFSTVVSVPQQILKMALPPAASFIFNIIICSLMPCRCLLGGFTSIFSLPKTLLRSRDVYEKQLEISLKRFCVKMVLDCSKLTWKCTKLKSVSLTGDARGAWATFFPIACI